jgi:hypothetical protein
MGAGLQAPVRQPVLEAEAGVQALHPDGGDRGARELRGSAHPAAGEVLNTQVVPKMIQRVLVEDWTAEKALEEGHKRIAEIYDRHNKG